MVYWKKANGFYKDFPVLKKDAYLNISRHVNQKKYKRVLDYGCGDGKLLNFINANCTVDLFDINESILNVALTNSNSIESQIFYDSDSIPDNTYEAIIFSLVLMCISDKNEIYQIVSKFKKCLKKNGEIIVLITHPCFRDVNFSYYRTDVDKPFEYFKEGFPFEVKIRNELSKIKFTDYHWSLTQTFNFFSKFDFYLTEMLEFKDKNDGVAVGNKFFSPYLKLIFKN